MKTMVIKDGRETVHEVFSCKRNVVGVGRVAYVIEEENGESRAAYGTPCACFYTLVIRAESGVCRLPDVSRDREEAVALCMRFACAAVLPANAREIFEELVFS